MRRAPAIVVAFLVACGGSTAPDGGAPADSTPEPAPNRAPTLLTFPTSADHDLPYDVTLAAQDPDGDAVTITVPVRPGWLDFDAGTARLRGTPGEARLLDSDPLRVRLTDGRDTVLRSFTMQVTLGTSRLRFDGPWVAQTGHPFGYDSLVLETAHFRVYSDFSAADARQRLADMLEAHYDTLSARLGVASDAEYEFPPGGRLHVYADKYQGDVAFGYGSVVNGWAFRDGAIVMAEDAPRYQSGGYNAARYSGLVMHEFMHTVEFLLIGRNQSINATDAWYREGIATFMPGLAPGGVPISTASQALAAQWRAQHATASGQGNPIAIHTFANFPAGANTGSWYFWFATAVRYLWDPAGFDLGYAGLRGIYDDVRAGLTFAESFAARTGISLAQFESEFWDRMDAFLPP